MATSANLESGIVHRTIPVKGCESPWELSGEVAEVDIIRGWPGLTAAVAANALVVLA